jgi:hypothetical protein
MLGQVFFVEAALRAASTKKTSTIQARSAILPLKLGSSSGKMRIAV